MEKENDFLSTTEAMQVLCLSYDGLMRYLLNGKLKVAKKIGRKNYYKISDIQDLKIIREKRMAISTQNLPS